MFAQGVTVSVGIPAVTIHPGDKNVSIPVTLSGDGSYSGPVTVTLTGLPSGITVTPVTTSPEGVGTLLLNASVSADQEAFRTDGPGYPDSSTTTVTAVALYGTEQATASMQLTVSLENPSFAPQPNQINLPTLSIDTNGAPIDSTETDVAGTVTITSADGETGYLPGTAGTDNTAMFHIHGNSTALMPKKPYEMKLNTSTDLLTAMGLSCPYVTSSGKAACDKSKTFILLANYDDKSMLRDWAASALANAIPIGGAYLNESANSPTPSGTSTLMPWAPHSLFVELYLNGQYEGTYQLIEKVNVDSHRINITEMSDTNISGNGLTGGYEVEIDQHQDEDYIWVTPEGTDCGLQDPDFSPEVPEQTTYITNYVNTAESALFASNYTDPTLGWRAYYDEASAVNFYIVNDLMGNVDGGDFYSSVYFYKDKNNPLLYMGPIWDFDISSGNVNYEAIVDPTQPWAATDSSWYSRWFSDPGFKADTQQQWNALKNNGVLASWLGSITTESATLEKAQQNNYHRWPMMGILVWPNAEAVGNYDGEVSYLTNWIGLRMGYMDAFLNNLPMSSTALTMPGQAVRVGSPMTLTAQVTGSSPSGTVTFLYNSIVAGQAAIGANGIASLTVSTVPAGTYSFEAYYNGDSHNSISGSISQPFTVLGPLVETISNLTAPTSSIYESSVTLTAAVIGVSGSGAPTGSFTFSSNGTALGTVQLSAAGTASLTTSSVRPGDWTVAASYSGDSNYAASTSNAVSLDVTQPVATVTLSNLSAIYDGSAQGATVATSPAGLSVGVTYNGSATVPTQAGTYAVTATVNDAVYAGSATGTLVISKATPTVSWPTPGAITYGTPLSAAQLDATSQTAGTMTYSSAAGTVLSAGTQTLTATLAATDATDYNTVSSSVHLTVNKQATTLALTTSASRIDPNQNITVTAQVAPASGGTPTGTVLLYNGTTVLSTLNLASGTATYTGGLPPGSQSFTAVYAGDQNFAGSQSTAVALTVLPYDFSVTSTGPRSISITPKESASFLLSVSPLYGEYAGPVNFSLTGLPQGFTYQFSPASLAANAGAQTVGLSVAPIGAEPANRPGRGAGGAAMMAFALLALPFAGRARRRLMMRALVVVLAGAALAIGLSGCGVDPPQTYNLSVIVNSGGMQHSVTFTLTENQ